MVLYFISLKIYRKKRRKKCSKYMEEQYWDEALNCFNNAHLFFGILKIKKKHYDTYFTLLFETNNYKQKIVIEDLKANNYTNKKFSINAYMYLLLYLALNDNAKVYNLMYIIYFEKIKILKIPNTNLIFCLLKGLHCYLNKDTENAKKYFYGNCDFKEDSFNCIFHYFKYKILIKEQNFEEAIIEKNINKTLNSTYKNLLEEEK